MKNVIRSLSKNKIKSVVHAALICIALSVVGLISTTYHVGLRIVTPLTNLSNTIETSEEFDFRKALFESQVAIRAVMSSLIPIFALLILTSFLLLPLLQYIYSINRGYEIGVMRALGLSKIRAWLHLFTESALITGLALVISQIVVLAAHRWFAFALLGIDAELQTTFAEVFSGKLNFDKMFGFSGYAFFITTGLAVVILIIASGFLNITVSRNAPLKLICEYKGG